MSRRFNGLCVYGVCRPIRLDGTTAEHSRGSTLDDCEGGLPIKGTERCGVCKKFRADFHISKGFAQLSIIHKPDCQQRTEQP